MNKKLNKISELITSIVWILKISFTINRLKFAVRILTTILYAVFPVVSYWLLKMIIDIALSQNPEINSDLKPILYLIALKIAFDVGWYFLDNLLENLFKVMRFDLEAFFINTVMSKLNRLDVEFYENSKFLDLKQKTLDTYTYRPTELLNIAFWVFYNLIQITIQSLIIIRISSLWLVLLFLFQIPALAILLKIGQSVWNIWDADSTTRRKFTYFSGLFENLAYIKEFKLYNSGGYFIEKIQNLVKEFHAHQKQIEQKRLILGFGGVLLSNLPVLYITISLLLMLINRQITSGLLIFYLGSLAAFSLALTNLVKNINYGYEVNLYIKEIRKFLNIKNKVTDIRPIEPSKNFNQREFAIEFKNISFSYPNSKRKVFSNFSLTIKPHKKIALVGENGSGKTTLIKLLCRFYDVQRGSIEINNVDIRNISLEILRSYFAVLFQDFVGYDLTVSENIAIGKIKDIQNKLLIKKAASMSGANKFIEKLPRKYQQILGSAFANGEQLSIGQWQRVALAKTFMRDSSIIILDEPTSAVDIKTENEIFSRVTSLIKDKTVLMVSHRFSTVRKADEIIVLKEGTIIERGTHDELYLKNGEYAQMFNLQTSAYK
ncbi:MAG: ABC transporter ATP-binding protein [bacterium]|nr:ABC transporter ATP-binding protein [bacterium]